jgi:hypothetical protein
MRPSQQSNHLIPVRLICRIILALILQCRGGGLGSAFLIIYLVNRSTLDIQKVLKDLIVFRSRDDFSRWPRQLAPHFWLEATGHLISATSGFPCRDHTASIYVVFAPCHIIWWGVDWVGSMFLPSFICIGATGPALSLKTPTLTHHRNIELIYFCVVSYFGSSSW